MMINSLNPLEKVRKIAEKGKVDRPQTDEIKTKGDSVEISAAAAKRLEEQKALEIAMSTPDIRLEKVNEMRQIIARGEFDSRYMNDEVLRKIADRIADSFLGNE